MSPSETPFYRGWDWTTGLGGVLVAVGLSVAGVGAYLHLSIAARVRAGQCDGCAPWHPLFVVAPLVVGVLIALGGGILSRRSAGDGLPWRS